MSIILGILEEGLIYAILALGVYITYSILDFPDLSVDSTFPLGAAVTAALLVAGVPAPAALLLSFCSGVLAGITTGLIHVKLKVVDLLSGIIVMTGLYSINLQIAGGANLAFFGSSTIFENSLTDPLWASPAGDFTIVIISLIAVLAVKFLLDAYLKTRSGYLLRAAGDNDTLVTTVMSNFGLYKALDEAGIRYEKTAVGDKYVWENMRENGHLIGGEQSGHIIFSKYATTGDGLITAIKVMQVMLDTKLPLSKLREPVTIYPQVLKNVIVDDKDGTLADAAVTASVAKVEAELGNTGRVLLRKSGTEPVLRVMAEAETDERCEAAVDEIIDAMRASGHLLKVK